MKVVFERLPDHQRGGVLIERDDGVVYRLDGGPVTAAPPHDLVHFTVEDAMEVADGIWGAIAGGVVFKSMTHVSGRRPPHAADRSAALIRAHRSDLQRAELLGGLVEAAAAAPGADVARLTAQWFGSRPEDAPDPARVTAAVAALHRVEERWRALAVGDTLTLTWPAGRRLRTDLAAKPRRR